MPERSSGPCRPAGPAARKRVEEPKAPPPSGGATPVGRPPRLVLPYNGPGVRVSLSHLISGSARWILAGFAQGRRPRGRARHRLCGRSIRARRAREIAKNRARARGTIIVGATFHFSNFQISVWNFRFKFGTCKMTTSDMGISGKHEPAMETRRNLRGEKDGCEKVWSAPRGCAAPFGSRDIKARTLATIGMRSDGNFVSLKSDSTL